MQLVLLRHAIAVSPETWTQADADRPLTQEGEAKFRAVAAALPRLLPEPRALLTSPLARAAQTAKLAAAEWKGLEPEPLDALVDGKWPGIARALAKYAADDTIILVGHEPWMSEVTSRLLGAGASSAFDFRKGGVAVFDLTSVKDCRGTLQWFIPPRVFRKLAR